MSAQGAKVTQLQPTEVSYRNQTITLTYRPRTNDWQYKIEYTRTITITSQATKYDEAVRNAKRDIDNMIGKPAS